MLRDSLEDKLPSRLAQVFKYRSCALASVAQLVETLSSNQKVVGLIPSQGTHLGFGFDPRPGSLLSLFWTHTGGNQLMILSEMFLSLPSFLKAVKNCPQMRIEK